MSIQEYKTCPKCEKEMHREEFRYGGQIRRYCKHCYPGEARRYQAEHAEHIRMRHANYLANPENRKRKCDAAKKVGQKLRRLVLEHYGGSPPKCACCGESGYEFLVLDHIDGGGSKHRRETTGGLGGLKMYRWVIENDFPSMFRVLCCNCNSSYGSYGYCPHQKDRNTP